MDVLGECSIGASWAIAARDGAGPSDPDLVVAGSGASILIFDSNVTATAIDLLAQQSGGQLLRLLPQGFVFDLELVGERLYVAAGKAGVVVFDTLTWELIPEEALELPPVSPFDPYEEARELEVLDLGAGRHLLAVGTTRTGQSGRQMLYDTSKPQNAELLQQFSELGEVQALVLTTDLYSSGTTTVVSLLAFSSCGPLHVNHYQFTAAAPQLVWLDTCESFQQLGAGFVRDALLHRPANHAPRIYAAAHGRGVRAYDLSLGAGPCQLVATEVTGAGSGWPLSEPGFAWYPVSLDLDPTFGRLAVGVQTHYFEEFQFSPGCAIQTTCNVIPPAFLNLNTQPEVAVYDVSNLNLPPALIVTADSQTVGVSHEIVGAAVRFRQPASATQFVIDCGSHNKGIGALGFKQQGPTWFVLSDWFDREQNLPIPTSDDLLIVDNVLYSATEKDVRGFALSASGEPLNLVPPLSVGPNEANQGPVGLAGFGGPDARVLGAAADGLVIEDISGSHALAPVTCAVNKGLDGPARLLTTLQGLSNAAWVNQNHRWVVIPVISDQTSGLFGPGTEKVHPGAVAFLDVGLAKESSELPATASSFRWPNAEGADTMAGTMDDVIVRFFGADIRPVDSSSALVYCTAQRGTNLVSTPGLARFRVAVSSREGRLQFSDPVFVPLADPLAQSSNFYQVWKLHYDPDGSLIYAAFACGGIATFQDLDGLAAPTLLEERHDLPGDAFEILRGPGDGLYVSMLGGGVGWVQDRLHVALHPLQVYPTRFQALGMALDPYRADRRRLYVADTQGGLLHLQFNYLPLGF